MGDHSRPKGQPRRRPGSAWRRYEQIGHEGGLAQLSGGGWYSERKCKAYKGQRGRRGPGLLGSTKLGQPPRTQCAASRGANGGLTGR